MSNLEPIDEKDLDLESKFNKPDEPIQTEFKEEKLPKVEKETASEIISTERDNAYNKILSRVQSGVQDVSQGEIKKDAEKTYEKQDAESQVRHLVDIAMNKGVVHAVKVARHMEDNYVLDMFHDKLLAEELHSALIEKGLLQDL